jgi:transposase
MSSDFPDLKQLSHEQKDDLIRQLWPLIGQVKQLTQHVEQLTRRIQELEGRLALSSRNSSKPPSSDGYAKPSPKSLRQKGQAKSGGQVGHKGTTLKAVAQPDVIQIHEAPTHCAACQSRLGPAEVAEVRQVFDLPTLGYEVTEHRVMKAQCTCGHVARGEFPEHVSAHVQYGPRVMAALVHLNQHHMLPVQRTAHVIEDLFKLPISEAMVLQACQKAQIQLEPTVEAIAQAVRHAPVVHADETGFRVNRTLHWLHVAATKTFTWIGAHAKRGQQAFEELDILSHCKGTLVHDGWVPYRALASCTHALCNAHHLRELTYIFEELKQPWAGDMIELLLDAHQQVHALAAPMPAHRLRNMRNVYDEILDNGSRANPSLPRVPGKRGPLAQGKAANLIRRLRDYADDVWRFATDPTVPFSNNVAEQAVRMPKVKQKISGGFRTLNGLHIFCTIRSYLATLRKQGINLFDALVQTFCHHPTQPNYSTL